MSLNNNAVLKNSSAKAAIDMALHDLFAQSCGLPLYKLLGSSTNVIDTSITISVKAIDEMVQDSISLVREGYKTLKIKVGLHAEDDIQRVKAIRKAVGDDITLLVDANQGWGYRDALRVIQTFEQHHCNIRLVEQPVKAADISNLKLISHHVVTPIIADEACFSPLDALTLAKLDACDGINIKLMKSGGLENAEAIYAIATTANLRLMVGCMLESPIGIAAMASFAVSKPDILFADLDAISLIRENYVLGGAQLVGNKIRLANKPGLGIEGFKEGLTVIGEIH